MGHRDPKARAAVLEKYHGITYGSERPECQNRGSRKYHGIRYGSQRPEGQVHGSREIPRNTAWVTETRTLGPR